MTGIGMAVNTHLNIFLHGAAIQEYVKPLANTRSVFTDAPITEGGYMYPIEKPGIGVTVDEEALMRFPHKEEVQMWTQARLPNGAIQSP